VPVWAGCVFLGVSGSHVLCPLHPSFSLPFPFGGDTALAPGLPFGISFMGTAFSEFKLISYAFAYEQRTHNQLGRLGFPAAVPTTQLMDVMQSNEDWDLVTRGTVGTYT
jgi:hypothetical protein